MKLEQLGERFLLELTAYMQRYSRMSPPQKITLDVITNRDLVQRLKISTPDSPDQYDGVIRKFLDHEGISIFDDTVIILDPYNLQLLVDKLSKPKVLGVNRNSWFVSPTGLSGPIAEERAHDSDHSEHFFRV